MNRTVRAGPYLEHPLMPTVDGRLSTPHDELIIEGLQCLVYTTRSDTVYAL